MDIAIATLATGSNYPITQEIYNQILEASLEDMIKLDNGTAFKVSAIMEITGKEEWEKQHPEKQHYNYGQLYTALPIGTGFVGLISSEKRLKGIEGMARGLQKAKDRRTAEGLESPNIDKFLEIARTRYKFMMLG